VSEPTYVVVTLDEQAAREAFQAVLKSVESGKAEDYVALLRAARALKIALGMGDITLDAIRLEPDGGRTLS
jgi:hypothetical protein